MTDKITAIAAPLLAVVIVVGVVVLTALSAPVPNELWAGMSLILGFFFGNQKK